MNTEDLANNLEKILILYNVLQELIIKNNLNELILEMATQMHAGNKRSAIMPRLIVHYTAINENIKNYKSKRNIVMQVPIDELKIFLKKEATILGYQSVIARHEYITITKSTSLEEFIQLSFSKYLPVLSSQTLEEKLSIKNSNIKKVKI